MRIVKGLLPCNLSLIEEFRSHFGTDRGPRKEHSLSYATDAERRTGVKGPGIVDRNLCYKALPIVIMAFLLTACTEEPPISLSTEDRALVDTLYSRKIEALRLQLDSICEVLKEEKIQGMVDSILEVRRAEEELLRSRIPLNLGEQE